MNNTAIILISDLVLPMHIGVYSEEHDAPQKVRINIRLTMEDHLPWSDDKYAQTICYHKLIIAIEQLGQSRHFKLVETLAEEISALCLDWPQAHQVSVRIEKLDTDNPVESVGIELNRKREEYPL